MEFDVTRIFNYWIIATFKNDRMQSFLLNHERKMKCIQELCAQIRICELSNIRRQFNVRDYHETIEGVASMFADACLKHAHEQSLSVAEKLRRMAEASHEADLTAEFAEMEKEALSNKVVSYVSGPTI